jgi:hypothetical protein
VFPAEFLVDIVKRRYKEVGLRDKKDMDDAKSYRDKLEVGMEGQQF